MFVYYNPNPSMRRVGDCTVRAICKASGEDWDKVYLDLATMGLRLKDMPSSNSVWGGYLKRKGWRQRLLPNTCPECYTISDFARDNPSGTFIMATGSHVVTVISGDWFDSWDSGEEIVIYYFERVIE